MTNGSNSIETIEVYVLNNPDEVNPCLLYTSDAADE